MKGYEAKLADILVRETEQNALVLTSVADELAAKTFLAGKIPTLGEAVSRQELIDKLLMLLNQDTPLTKQSIEATFSV